MVCLTRLAEETISDNHHRQDQEMITNKHPEHGIRNIVAFSAM
jgi:hypothetical protein